MKYFNKISKNNYDAEPLLKSNCTSSLRSEQQNGFLISKLYNNIIRLKKKLLNHKMQIFWRYLDTKYSLLTFLCFTSPSFRLNSFKTRRIKAKDKRIEEKHNQSKNKQKSKMIRTGWIKFQLDVYEKKLRPSKGVLQSF